MSTTSFRKFDAFAVLAEMESTTAKVAKPAKASENFGNFCSREAQISTPAQTTLATLATLAAGTPQSQRRLTEQVNSGSPSAKVAKPAKADESDSRLGVNPVSLDEERAAIVEYEAGVPRAWGEGLARLGVMPRPEGIGLRQWQRLIDAARAFIDKFGSQAAALEWSTGAIFGCHPEAPLARLDLAGLVFFVDDGEIIAITKNSARIRKPGGSVLTYTRREPRPGEPQVPVWRLSDEPAPTRRHRPRGL